jgi:hypothetical protein
LAITLQSPIVLGQDDEFGNQVLNILGPGAGKLSISGNNQNRIFHVGPFLGKDGVTGLTATTINGLTLENGQADEGGAILDDSASLILAGDVFNHDRAVGGSGNDGLGGAVAILYNATPGMSVQIIACQFSNDSALGGTGKVDNSGNELNGGDARGGALYVNAGSSNGLFLSVIGSRFTNDSAIGGKGINADGSAGTAATDGGNGLGGAMFLFTNTGGVPLTAVVVLCEFSDCSAVGGPGGNSGESLSGGQDGVGRGGAIYIGAGASVYDFVVFFSQDHADFGPDVYGAFAHI